jgi:hypothetical protein
MATGLTQTFAQVGAMRAVSGLGSSVQHPVGAAILVSYFEKRAAVSSLCIIRRETSARFVLRPLAARCCY